MARYAGLRTPSETCEITWRGVDWSNNALTVPVRKTRRYASERVVPIVPELLTLLEKAYWIPDSADRIVTVSNASIRRTLPKILEAAGIPVWSDLFQTLRRSCETHLIVGYHNQDRERRRCVCAIVAEHGRPQENSGKTTTKPSTTKCEFHSKEPRKLIVARAGNDPATHGFSIRCSTN